MEGEEVIELIRSIRDESEENIQKFIEKLKEARYIEIYTDGHSDAEDGIWKLFTSLESFMLNYFAVSPEGYAGFIEVKNEQILSAQDLRDEGTFFAIKIADILETEEQKEKIIRNCGFFFGQRDNWLGGGKDWRRDA